MVHEMFLSHIFAQIFGLYLVIMAIVMASRKQHFEELFNNLKPNSSGILLGSSYGLLLGLFLVCIHNLWIYSPYVVLTVFFWAILIKSVVWLAFPERALAISKKLYCGKCYYIWTFLIAVLGIYFMVIGYHHYM